MDSGLSRNRVRLSSLADELGVDFPELFRHFCQTCPHEIDDMLTVPTRWRGILAAFQSGRFVT